MRSFSVLALLLAACAPAELGAPSDAKETTDTPPLYGPDCAETYESQPVHAGPLTLDWSAALDRSGADPGTIVAVFLAASADDVAATMCAETMTQSQLLDGTLFDLTADYDDGMPLSGPVDATAHDGETLVAVAMDAEHALYAWSIGPVATASSDAELYLE